MFVFLCYKEGTYNKLQFSFIFMSFPSVFAFLYHVFGLYLVSLVCYHCPFHIIIFSFFFLFLFGPFD